jgi:lysophospholipase L1-like esterase
MRTTALFLLSAFTAYSQATAPATPDEKFRTELDRAQKTLKDWANLGRYRSDNASVTAPAAGEKRVVFMGDSITDSWGRNYGKFFPGKPYINRGISGQTTAQMLIRFRPDVIALKPKAVVILAGTNDIAGNTGPATLEEIEGNLTSMAELARANGIKVVLASVMPVTDAIKPQTGRRPPEKINALNAWIKEYARKTGAVYLDYYSAMVDGKGMLKQELTYDGLHPNDAGYQLIEPVAQKAIDAALKYSSSARVVERVRIIPIRLLARRRFHRDIGFRAQCGSNRPVDNPSDRFVALDTNSCAGFLVLHTDVVVRGSRAVSLELGGSGLAFLQFLQVNNFLALHFG